MATTIGLLPSQGAGGPKPTKGVNMSLKTILVHIDDQESSALRLDVAIRIAGNAGARLVGVYLVPTIEISPSVAALMPSDLAETIQRGIGEAQHAAERRFRAAAGTARLTAVEWRAPAGPAIAAAVAHGRCADLFVVGQGEPGNAASAFSRDLIASTLVATGHPLLIVPFIGAARTFARNVMVAWDGGREAARAVADALPLLADAGQVVVVTDSNGAGAITGEAPSTSELLGWLRDHGVEARTDALIAGEGGVGESLLSRAADLSTDLIVMGGYGHARMREFVLGGVTRTLLESMTIPVLMSH